MKNKNVKKNQKGRRPIDIITIFVLLALVVVMCIFTVTRQADNQEIILMEIYKSAGPNSSTASMEHYYIFENTNQVTIRNSNSEQINNNYSKEVEQSLIDNLKVSLDNYISENHTINNNFYINERYTIEYNGKSLIVPNPSVAAKLGYNSDEYTFYNIIDNFINIVNN